MKKTEISKQEYQTNSFSLDSHKPVNPEPAQQKPKSEKSAYNARVRIFALPPLKRAIVLSEVLGKPRSLHPYGSR